MSGLGERLFGFLLNEDRGLNALGGGKPDQTISGTVGRACGSVDPGQKRWWGPGARFAIEIQPWFGRGHCARAAQVEAAAQRAAIQP